uniref:SnoaL-like domain-containing protein n=1 Tax=Eutreptiella gymnastica TaxID=73025 RepID=A0A7S1NFQ0_9EUGL
MTQDELLKIMTDYGRAWETQDPDLLCSLFTEDGTYQVTPFDAPHKGQAALRSYWERMPVADQRDIKFTLGVCNAVGSTGYAEWITNFFQVSGRCNVEIRGIIILEVEHGKISELREYWKSYHSGHQKWKKQKKDGSPSSSTPTSNPDPFSPTSNPSLTYPQPVSTPSTSTDLKPNLKLLISPLHTPSNNPSNQQGKSGSKKSRKRVRL